MSKGESTSAAAHHNRDDQLEESNEEVAKKEIRVQNLLAELDADLFERVLQRATDATNISGLLESASGEQDPTLVNNSIMGLIDGTKEIVAAEKERNTIHTTRAPVKFDEVIDFIDDGAEEIIIEKKPTSSATFTVTSPIRGNPVVDLDNGTNGKADGEEENYLMKMEQDPISRMEMGNAPPNNSVSIGPVAMAVDDLDLDKVLKSQKNNECSENEQIAFLQERNLHEFAKYNNVLGPLSKGEFASFAKKDEIIGCDLGVYSPISSAGRSVFQTCTSNGRLLPAVPRKLFLPNDAVPGPRPRPNAYKSLTTVMLNTASPNSCKTAEPGTPKTTPPPPPVNPLEVAKAQNNAAYIRNKKKKNRKYAKLAAAAALAADGEEFPDAAGEDKDDSNSTITDYEGEEEEEKENEDGITEEEKEARRLKNRKAREKKRVKKDQELLQQKQQSPVVEAPRKVGSNTANEEPVNGNGNTNSGGRKTAEEKKDKKEKNVQNSYTVAQYENEEELKKNLQELGIESDDLGTQTGKKKKKESLKKAENKKKEVQNNNKKQQKAATVPAPQPEEEKTAPDGNNKQKPDKMDEVAVAASITKRCSSGAGQQSEEDDDQSYVSAQENLGGSNSRLSTPPAEFVDARQSRDEVTENVMADPNNYRKDEEVEGLAKQLEQEENEFVVVGSKNNKKKNKPLSITTESVSTSSNTSSSSPTTRRNTHPDTKAPSTAASSVSNFNTSSNTNQQQQQRNSNRPVAHPTTLGDFMESTKKETHKNAKHKKVGPLTGSPSGQNKKQTSFDEPQPASPAFVDAVETPISVNTSPPTFSYADAAKKTSGENTPAHEMSPVPAPVTAMSPAPSTTKKASSPQSQNGPAKSGKSKSSSPPPLETAAPSQPSFASAVSGVQLPPSSAAAASAGISFGYEETPVSEDKRKRQQKKSKTASPPPPAQQQKQEGAPQQPRPQEEQPSKQQSQQTSQQQSSFDARQFFDQVKGAGKNGALPKLAADLSKDDATCGIVESWKKGWEAFMSGPEPTHYKPSNKK